MVARGNGARMRRGWGEFHIRGMGNRMIWLYMTCFLSLFYSFGLGIPEGLVSVFDGAGICSNSVLSWRSR